MKNEKKKFEMHSRMPSVKLWWLTVMAMFKELSFLPQDAVLQHKVA